MTIDRQLKKKKKREEKQKARRQEAQRQLLQEKAAEYGWEAGNAFRAKDYERALFWAQKKLKLEPADSHMRSLALHCTQHLGDDEAFYSLFCQSYQYGQLTTRHNGLILAEMAYERKQYELAREVLQAVLSDSSSLTGKLLKSRQKQAQQIYAWCLARVHSATKKLAEAKQPAVKEEPAARVPSAPKPPSSTLATAENKSEAGAGALPTPQPEALPALDIAFKTEAEPLLEALQAHRRSDPATLNLALKAYRLSFRTSYDQLLCLPTLREVKSLWYQEETARKVMKTFRGRAILADEVGLGKTVEAGLILKEYMLRGLVRTALILVPSSLVNQWQEELRDKFAIPVTCTNDALFRQDPERFWHEPLVLASLQTAKLKRHFEAVTSRSYDMVIVDEAHHLKNRTTLNWKLVNSVQKSFLLMLTATPVQNNLEELFNLVTLLQPGHLKTLRGFKEEFMTRGNPTDPRNREKLRQLLKEVMVRNTRSVTQLHLPPRFALTVRVNPTAAEEAFYQAISAFVRELEAGNGSGTSRFSLRRLLETAGSSHLAALRMLEKMPADGKTGTRGEVAAIIRLGAEIQAGAKAQKVMELLKASSDQKVLFVNTVATLEHLQRLMTAQNIPHVVFQGGLTPVQKQAVMDRFRDGCPVLLSTGMGGEGFNLQFCHVMINYDLPWNPMEIEQRIGRLHRIGQADEVQVFNFCTAGSLEDHILEVLDRKINMFELVVGEIDMILGRLQGEEEFSDLVYDIWVRHADEPDRRKAFDALAGRLKRARSSYEKSRELDERIFREDFGV
jgi:SNF2 family DNA or RNA helicase